MAQRATSICLCFLWFTYASQNNKVHVLRDKVAEMCPFTSFCHKNASRSLENGHIQENLCCLPCSCELDCWKTASCCIDKDDLDDMPPALECKQTLVKRGYFQGKFSGYGSEIRRYHIIDFCPETQKSSDIDQMCKAEHPVKLENFVWVSDKENGMIYQNQYCAECHGVNDFLHWQIKTDCMQLLQTNFSSVSKDLSFYTCYINNESPDIIRHVTDKYRCVKPNFNNCNQSGMWKKFDLDLSSACDRYNLPVFQAIAGHFLSYKNVFCYLCNGEKKTDFSTSCSGYDDVMKSLLVRFSALLNFDKYIKVLDQAIDDDQLREQCQFEEVFDIYIGRCRTLFCPYGSAAWKGRCEQVLTNINGLSFELVFHLKVQAISNSKVVNDEDKLKSLGRKIITSFQSTSGLRRSRCQFCNIYVYLTANSDDDTVIAASFYLLATLFTDTRCKLDKVREIFNAFVETNLTIYVTDTDYLVFRTAYDTRGYTELSQISEKITDIRGKSTCRKALMFSPEKFCPAVDLNHFEIYSHEEIQTRRLLIELFEIKRHLSGVLRICLDEYYYFMSQRISAAAFVTNTVLCKLFLVLALFYF